MSLRIISHVGSLVVAMTLIFSQRSLAQSPPYNCFNGSNEEVAWYQSYYASQAAFTNNPVNTFYSPATACSGNGYPTPLKAATAVALTLQGQMVLSLCLSLGDNICPLTFSNQFTFLYDQSGIFIPDTQQAQRDNNLATEITAFLATSDVTACSSFMSAHPWMN